MCTSYTHLVQHIHNKVDNLFVQQPWLPPVVQYKLPGAFNNQKHLESDTQGRKIAQRLRQMQSELFRDWDLSGWFAFVQGMMIWNVASWFALPAFQYIKEMVVHNNQEVKMQA